MSQYEQEREKRIRMNKVELEQKMKEVNIFSTYHSLCMVLYRFWVMIRLMLNLMTMSLSSAKNTRTNHSLDVSLI